MTNTRPYVDLEDFFKYIASFNYVFQMDLDRFSDFDSSDSIHIGCTSNDQRICLELQHYGRTYNIDIKPSEVKSLGPIVATNFIKGFLGIKKVQSRLYTGLYQEISPHILTYLDKNYAGIHISAKITNPITRHIIGTFKPINKEDILFDSDCFEHVYSDCFQYRITVHDHLLCNTLWFCYVDTMNFLNQ